MKILIIQTAFLGDVILTLPMVQAIRRAYQGAEIHMMVTPVAADIAEGSPVIGRTIIFDKKGRQRGLTDLVRLGLTIRSERYDAVVTPHRSLRTAILTAMSGAKVRIGFRSSAVPWVFNQRIAFNETLHEVDRNLQLLRGFSIEPERKTPPDLRPTDLDRSVVDAFLRSAGISDERLIAIAPGSVWFTKRWPAEKYAGLIRQIDDDGLTSVLIGGKEDIGLADRIQAAIPDVRIVSAVGKFSLLQSADLIRRAKVLVTNDSGPLHLGVAMRTRVIAIFGPTVPAFGFAPYGDHDVVLGRDDLSCRPCTKHGGAACPIGTFECMESISSADVFKLVKAQE